MKTPIYAALLANLVLLSTFVPAVFAQPFDRHDNRRDNRPSTWQNNRPSIRINNWHDNRRDNRTSNWQNNRRYYRHDNFPVRNGQFTYRQQRNFPTQRLAANNNWNWNQHNWNDQRTHLRNNWRRSNSRFSAQQQQQLDAQMRAQWLRYHNNNWNGPNNWDQYSDPNFLDYIHNNNPSLMTRIRSRFGF